MRKYMDNEFQTILNTIITPGMNELEKVLAVYRYFADRITYNYEWLEGFNMSDTKYMYPSIEIYEALKTNKGVCHSYTYLCEFALQQLGIECVRVTGEMKDSPDDGHMWLLARIDGEWYHCDPTWDSTNDGKVGLQYFGMTDKERTKWGIDFNYVDIDIAYEKIACKSTLFKDFREVTDFTFGENHTLILHSDANDKPMTYDTVAKKIIQ